MRKKMLSITLCLVLVLTLLPTVALATDGAIVTVGGVELTYNGTPVYATTDATGAVTAGGDETNYNVKWDGTTLTLRDATITGAASGGLGISASVNLSIVPEGTNTVTGTAAADGSYGIWSDGDVNISGGGTLTVNTVAAIISCGISAHSVTFNGSATVTVTAGQATIGISCGISGTGSVTIQDSATVTITGGEAANDNSYGIRSNSVTINGGQVTAIGGAANDTSYGIYSDTDITYNDGLLVAKGGKATTSMAMNKAATGAGAGKIISSKSDGSGTSDYNDKYIVYGDADKYDVILSDHVFMDTAATLMNTIIIGGDTSTYDAHALTLFYGGTLTLKGFNVVLAGNSSAGDSAAVQAGGTLTIDGDGSLVAIGSSGATGSYGINATGITISRGSGVAIAGSGPTAQALSANPTLSNLTDAMGVWTGNVLTWQPQPVIEVDLDGSGDVNAPAKYRYFEQGWNAAITDNTASTTVKLLKDWAADATTHSFGTGDGFNNGSILIPADIHIAFDLNGKTVDRGLDTVQTSGSVIKVLGSLTLSDSSTGGTITGGADSVGGGVYVADSGSFTMNGGRFTGIDVGSVVHVSGTATMTGGSITDNKAGGVYVSGSGSFTMTGGSITDNTNGVFIKENGSFTMNGGSITGSAGGGVSTSYYATLSMNGGSITDNRGGGVNASGTFRVSGNPVITDNTVGGVGTEARNVFRSDGKTISVTGALTSDAVIGVSAEIAPTDDSPVQLATGGTTPSYTITADDAAKFFSDAPQYGLYQDGTDNNIYLRQLYQVQRDEDLNGTFALSPATSFDYYAAGETVTILPNLADNYVVDTVACMNGSETVTVTSNSFIMPAHGVTVTVTFKKQRSTNGNASPSTANSLTNATRDISLTGGFAYGEKLITDCNPPGSAYEALLKLADSDDVFSTYSIYLGSGEKSTGKAMNLTFDLNSKYTGQDFTLVHQKADSTYEYFYDAADANGDLTFGPLYELSPFMLVAGTLTPFEDVSESDWFNKDVAYVYMNKLFSGTFETTFEPETAMTRAMLVTVLYRLEGEPMVNQALPPFTDAQNGGWFINGLNWAFGAKLVEGYNDGSFGINDPVTREQLAMILYRYAQYKGYDVSVGEDTNILSYDDAFDIAEYAIPAIQWACGAGLIQGDAGNLMPRGSAQRSQVAAIFHRFCENVK